ncbi:molybdate-anion transporter [Halyomorpha halys]|uniref:molybdate-anion transporter n=1 Tax=Halyomorpha halys TaxID=286706 RepID=UPI0006D4FA44|nr:molybdate-anion transporter-like [Halyomorpha halys]
MIPRTYNLIVKKWKTVKRQIEKAIVGAFVIDKKSHTIVEPHNVHYKNLQKCYLIAFYLSTFADWLQGPYIYKLYADYGYTDDTIALLYITGFASSCLFGTVIGQMADRFGRKLLCSTFGIFYSLCCLSKISSKFTILFIGRILGGISTSILFTTFEAWYVNEHLNFYKLPPEWLNNTFTRATFYNGLSAIIAGITAQILAEYFNFGPVSPFLFAIPFLITSLLVIQSTWKEHSAVQQKSSTSFISSFFEPIRLLFQDDYLLLFLGIIQSVFEAVMYAFIFSWTPILTNLKPPLGLIFSMFMVSLMGGSKLYASLISQHYYPQNLLIFTTVLSAFSFCIVTLSLTNIVVHVETHDLEPSTMTSMSLLCLSAFLVYEFSVGMYYPAMGYLRSRIFPEECRASLSNWFRVPMNVITCLTLLIKEGNHAREFISLKKFQLLFSLCTVMLVGTICLSVLFAKKYSKKIIQDELNDLRTGKSQPSETV